MRMRSVLLGSLVFAAGLVALSPEAEATSLKKMTTVQMVDGSDLIVRGTVAETWTEVGENGRIWTRAQLDIIRVYKGESQIDTVVVDQLGGAFGGVTMHVEGATRFSTDEEIVIFLDELESGRICPLGMFSGKWTVRLDPYSQTEIVQRFTVGAGENYDHRFIPLPQSEDRIFLSDFETTVIDRVRTAKAAGPQSEVK
jgi:hypothetical protein